MDDGPVLQVAYACKGCLFLTAHGVSGLVHMCKKVLHIFGKQLVAYVAFALSTNPSMFTLHPMKVCINFPYKQLTQSKQQQQPQTHWNFTVKLYCKTLQPKLAGLSKTLNSKFEFYRKIYRKIYVWVEIPYNGWKPDGRNHGRTTRYHTITKQNVSSLM
jgi:hypothetical protein